MWASFRGHTEVVQLRLDQGESVDLKHKEGRKALLLASLYGHTELVKLLRDQVQGASVDPPTVDENNKDVYKDRWAAPIRGWLGRIRDL